MIPIVAFVVCLIVLASVVGLCYAEVARARGRVPARRPIPVIARRANNRRELPR